ncbi:MAG: hypothetical protein DRN37_06490, partial [Thermoplasmata archaeon]
MLDSPVHHPLYHLHPSFELLVEFAVCPVSVFCNVIHDVPLPIVFICILSRIPSKYVIGEYVLCGGVDAHHLHQLFYSPHPLFPYAHLRLYGNDIQCLELDTGYVDGFSLKPVNHREYR